MFGLPDYVLAAITALIGAAIALLVAKMTANQSWGMCGKPKPKIPAVPPKKPVEGAVKEAKKADADIKSKTEKAAEQPSPKAPAEPSPM